MDESLRARKASWNGKLHVETCSIPHRVITGLGQRNTRIRNSPERRLRNEHSTIQAITRTLLRHRLVVKFEMRSGDSVWPISSWRHIFHLRTPHFSWFLLLLSPFGHKCYGNLFRKVITESGGDVSSFCVCFHITVRCNRSHICTQLFHISFATQFVCSSFYFNSVIALMDLALLYDLFFIIAKLILERRMAIKNSRQTPANELPCWAIVEVTWWMFF